MARGPCTVGCTTLGIHAGILGGWMVSKCIDGASKNYSIMQYEVQKEKNPTNAACISTQWTDFKGHEAPNELNLIGVRVEKATNIRRNTWHSGLKVRNSWIPEFLSSQPHTLVLRLNAYGMYNYMQSTGSPNWPASHLFGKACCKDRDGSLLSLVNWPLLYQYFLSNLIPMSMLYNRNISLRNSHETSHAINSHPSREATTSSPMKDMVQFDATLGVVLVWTKKVISRWYNQCAYMLRNLKYQH